MPRCLTAKVPAEARIPWAISKLHVRAPTREPRMGDLRPSCSKPYPLRTMSHKSGEGDHEPEEDADIRLQQGCCGH
ncbi:MAG: hypothetical protein RLZZ141_1564 [Pseudomonadota bacterium]